MHSHFQGPQFFHQLQATDKRCDKHARLSQTILVNRAIRFSDHVTKRNEGFCEEELLQTRE